MSAFEKFKSKELIDKNNIPITNCSECVDWARDSWIECCRWVLNDCSLPDLRRNLIVQRELIEKELNLLEENNF